MIWVPTTALVFKNTARLKGVHGGTWDLDSRLLLADTDKHRSIYQRFVEGREWEQTDVFTKLYVERFLPHDRQGYQAKLDKYRNRLETVFRSMRLHGFKTACDLPRVLIGRDGDVMLGNQGNHRVAMAKVLGIASVPCEVQARHSDWATDLPL